MDAKDILKKIKAVFDGTQVIAPAPVPAPAPQPAKLATNYPVDNGQPVYVDTTIDVNAAAWTDEAMTMPYPDGTYTVTGTDFSFTVAAGIVTAVSGTLVAPTAAAVPPAPAPLPMGPTLPQFEAMQTEVNELKAQNAKLQEALIKANLLAEKHEKILPDLFALAEKLTELPTATPKALNEREKEKFDYAAQRDDRFSQIAKTLKKIKN